MTDSKRQSDFPPEEPASGVRLRDNVTRLPTLKPKTWGECQAEGLGSRVPCIFKDCEHSLSNGGETCVLAVVEANEEGLPFRDVGKLLGVHGARIQQIEKKIVQKPRVRRMLLAWAENRTRYVGGAEGAGLVGSIVRTIRFGGGLTTLEVMDRLASDRGVLRAKVSRAISRLVNEGVVLKDEDGALWLK